MTKRTMVVKMQRRNRKSAKLKKMRGNYEKGEKIRYRKLWPRNSREKRQQNNV